MPRIIVGHTGKPFHLVRELGRGGFGVVYLANDEAQAPYALKLIGPVRDHSAQETFEREVQGAQAVSDDHVLKVIDFGSDQPASGDLYLFTVTEYCPDGDYRLRLRAYSATSPSVDRIIADFQQILGGLEALHARVIYRDIKPENILLSRDTLKIGDFGLSKFVDQATKTLTFKGSGSPRYMAPEVWQMRRATPATDLYAVGVMLFEALTGRPPFEAGDINALRDLHLFRPAPRAKSLNRAIPDKLDGVVKKLLEKEPSNRYQTAGEVLDALKAIQTSGVSTEIEEIATRLRQHHDAVEERRLGEQRRREAQQSEIERNRYKEQVLLDLFEEVISQINAHLEEVKIRSEKRSDGAEYSLGDRSLVVRFFNSGELYEDPEVPARMEILRKRHVVHGGYIEIREGGEDREGWNVVLIRPPESLYGTWILVETEVSPLTGRITRYKPIATEARLFADNLACHWMPAMHIYQMKDKPLEQSDIIKIIQTFIPTP